MTRTGFGAQYAAALIVNKATFNKLPPALQKILREVGQEWTAQADKVQFDAGNSGFAMATKFKGKTYELPRAEQDEMGEGACRISPRNGRTAPTKEGLPGNKVLAAYMDAMRAAGAKPVRDWDKN